MQFEHNNIQIKYMYELPISKFYKQGSVRYVHRIWVVPGHLLVHLNYCHWAECVVKDEVASAT